MMMKMMKPPPAAAVGSMQQVVDLASSCTISFTRLYDSDAHGCERKREAKTIDLIRENPQLNKLSIQFADLQANRRAADKLR